MTASIAAYATATFVALGAATAAPPSLDLPPPREAPESERWSSAPTERKRLAARIRADARDNAPELLGRLYRLANFEHLHADPRQLSETLDFVRSLRRVSPLTRVHAAWLRARLTRHPDASAQQGPTPASLGLVDVGRWRGPFPNDAGGGHRAVYPPELPAARPDQWPSLEGLVPHGRIELSSLAHPSEAGTAYATFVALAPRRMKVALRVGATDAVTVWIRGRRALERDTRTFAELDQYSVGVWLEPGPNPILVKVAWSGHEGAALVRISSPDGAPVPSLVYDGSEEAIRAAWKRYPIEGDPASVFPVATVTSELERAAETSSGQNDDRLAVQADLVSILGLYDRRRRPTVPEQLLVRAIRDAPEKPEHRFHFAHRVRHHDPSRAREQAMAALHCDPRYAPAYLLLAELERESGRVFAARRILDGALSLDPDLSALHLARAQLGYELLDEDAIALSRLHEAITARPPLSRQPSLHTQLAHMFRGLGNLTSARAHAEIALTLDPSDGGARMLASRLALDTEGAAAARPHLQATIRDRPFSLGPRLHLARVLLGHSADLEGARATLQDARTVFAQHPRLHEAIADLELYADDSSAAVEALEAALALDPHQPELRQRLRVLSGSGERLETRYTNPLAAHLKTPPSELERRWGAAYLLDHTVIRRFDNGKSARFRQYLLRVQNPRLEAHTRTHRIPYAPSRESVQVLSAERIRPNGETVPASSIVDEAPRGKVSGMYLDRQSKRIAFDELGAGDVVHVRYRIDSVGENIFGGFFGDIQHVQSGLPIRDYRYRVIAPRTQPLAHAGSALPSPTAHHQGDDTHLEWRAANIPGLDPEPLSLSYPGQSPILSVSSYSSWQELGRWYGRLFSEQLVLDEAAREASRAVLEGASTDEDKVRRLYNYVVQSTRYVGIELGIHGWKPFPAAEVHRRRYGDCKDKATLLAALLEDNGIPATVTLVRTSDRSALPEGHATMWAFNHAITYVPSLDLFLDPTAEFHPSTELPALDQGAMALIVHRDGQARLVKLPESSASQNRNVSDYSAKFGADDRLTLDGREAFSGAPAAEVRRQMQTPDERAHQLERGLAPLFPGAKAEALEFSQLDDLDAPVSYGYRVLVPRYGQRNGATLTFPVALFRHEVAATYAPLVTRRTPIHLAHPWTTTNRVRYQLPPGAKLRELPESRTLESPYISLVQKIQRTRDGFITEETVTLPKRVIPVSEYEGFRRACLAIDRAMSRRVVLEW